MVTLFKQKKVVPEVRPLDIEIRLRTDIMRHRISRRSIKGSIIEPNPRRRSLPPQRSILKVEAHQSQQSPRRRTLRSGRRTKRRTSGTKQTRAATAIDEDDGTSYKRARMSDLEGIERPIGEQGNRHMKNCVVSIDAFPTDLVIRRFVATSITWAASRELDKQGAKGPYFVLILQVYSNC